MKVLVVTQYFWPESFGINDLVAGLVEKGNEVTVLTGIPNYPGGKIYSGYGHLGFKNNFQKYRNVTVVRVPIISRGETSKVRLALNYFSFLLSATILSPFLLYKREFDVIFVYQLSPITVAVPAIVLKSMFNCPLVMWIQDLWPESVSATGAISNKSILKALGWLVSYIYKRCDLVLVQSPAFIPKVTSYGISEDSVIYYPNSVDGVFFRNIVNSGKHLLPKGFRIVFAGNIGVAQDFETILSAAEKTTHIKEIKWVVLGDGRRAKWLENEVQERGLTDTFILLGRFPTEEMPGLYAESDVMLATLKSDPIFALTIPSKIQSYMACGKPIIACMDGEGAKLVVDSGSGVAVPSGDSAGLASSVLSLYKLPKKHLAQYGERSQKCFESEFERGKLIKRLDGLLREVV